MLTWCTTSRSVGANGRVVGTDIDPRFLEEIHESNFEAWKHDITADPVPTGQFDLVGVVIDVINREAVVTTLNLDKVI